MGSLAAPAQLERVCAHVEDARSKGALVLAGGHPRPQIGPYFYEPTILWRGHRGYGLPRRRDARPGRVRLPRGQRRRGHPAGQRQSVSAQHLVGFAAPFGLFDKLWAKTLTVVLGAMKRLECGNGRARHLRIGRHQRAEDRPGLGCLLRRQHGV